ncbi:MAG: Bax inhibitor-1/YccA family protein [Candidatus Omnitrophica bacterium]|nr:Bax inhibitor-1/YccA family protein [Candidatus Omnitrophota bacterium]MCF7877263.1 Bax inhibitor-1/YccA family protein [Candidatus Omnitrophota bacterium]
MRSGNPALKGNTFSRVSQSGSGTMSLQGTVNKTLILLGLTFLSSWWVWQNPAQFTPFMLPAVIVGFILALVTIFRKEWSPLTSPLYALVEGVFLGAISAIFEKQYPGIVIQAVGLTFGVLFCLLLAYKSGMIKVTQNFRLGVVAATGGIALLYFINIIMSFFGARISFIHEAGLLGIGFSLFVVVIASLNLVLDFDFIEKGAEAGVPKYMEWYGAFGLIVTLIWLYLEILRLLAKLQRR